VSESECESAKRKKRRVIVNTLVLSLFINV